MFGSLADALSRHLHVIRWDQRGSGRSERRGPYSVARSADDLDAVRGHFGLAKTVLLGNVAFHCGEKITWDDKAGKVTDSAAAAKYLQREYRKGWEL